MENLTLGQSLQEHIKATDNAVALSLVDEKRAKPPVVQEIVLARRHLEDANNRFKKAYNLLSIEDR